MQRSFQCFDQLLDVLIFGSQARVQRDGRHHEPLLLFGLSRRGEAEAQEMVDGSFERIAGAFGFVLNQARNIVIEGECGSHIMMLRRKAS